ncbi:hypothetical protein LCGC14_1322750 [marine sediment metagenome]|uniref:Uncharacterized protein n=1 Tax=marine sediment metagenome TaxID=412755 RepID=A0A0F9L4G6_9ZZZZ
MIKTINLRYIEERFEEIKEEKTKAEKELGRIITWEDFIYNKIRR